MTCSPRLAAASIGAAVLLTAAAALAQVAFSRVITQPGLGPIELAHVLAVADLNGDGRDDILAGGLFEYDAYATHTLTPEDRFVKSTLHVFVGVGDGSFEHAPELIEGTIAVRSPIVVADDFNTDGRADLAVFDEGVYVFAVRRGYGNPPQLFLSSLDGRLRPSDALADAVRREHELRLPPDGFVAGPADLHLKSATSGDIDGDGDSRVEGRRVTSRESVAHPALSHRAAVRVPWARFLPPLSEPGVPISGTGLSSGIMRLAHGLSGCDQRAGLASRGTRLTPWRWPAGASSDLLTP